MPEQHSHPASSTSPLIPGVTFLQPGWVMDAWQWAGMWKVPRRGAVRGFAGVGMGAEVLLQSAPPLQLPLSSAASGRPNLAFAIFGSTLSVEVENGTGSTHTQIRGIQGSCDLQALCKAISVSRMLSHSPAFPRCLNPTALLAWDGFLSLGQCDSAAAVPPSSPHEKALLMLQLVLQLHRGAKNGRMGWLPLYTIPL